MLEKFVVTNFKNFKTKLEFNLGETSSYEFNENIIQNGCISKCLIYGQNGSGKSNLGLAIFDIIIHLTDKAKILDRYELYTNLNSNKATADFEYHFAFNGHKLVYLYSKRDAQKLTHEKVIIDGEEVIDFNFDTNEGYTTLDGAEQMTLSTADPISRVKAIKNGGLLLNTPRNKVFREFFDFVEGMLLFYSLRENRYQGYKVGVESITQVIINQGKLSEFEAFLRKHGIDYELVVMNDSLGQKDLGCKFSKGVVPLLSIASTGTISLTLFYYWYISISKASLVFMDEFDAFYHYELSQTIVEMMRELNIQVILTTHNTDLMSNDLLRPDAYFIIEKNQIHSLAHLTNKELRRAHNLQKMYKAGSFND